MYKKIELQQEEGESIVSNTVSIGDLYQHFLVGPKLKERKKAKMKKQKRVCLSTRLRSRFMEFS